MSKNIDPLTLEAGSPENPSIFGKYLLLGLVARGGMAEVYRAKRLKKEEGLIALKAMRTKLLKEQKYIDMFLAEGTLGRMLQHPNIVETHEGGRHKNVYFFTMEYISGKDLTHVLRKVQLADQRLPVPVAVYIAQKSAEALHYAHTLTDKDGNCLNLVNRDVSPSNIRISYDGEVKIIDFGIARARNRATSEIGTLKGKFSYMSPEQIRGLPLDGQTDIFSLGIVLYEMLTMERLFKGESETVLMEKVRQSVIPPPSTINKRVSTELDEVVLRALSRDKKTRYQTAGEFAEALLKILTPYKFSVNELGDLMKRLFHDDWLKDREVAQIASTLDGQFQMVDTGKTESFESLISENFDVTGIMEMEVDMDPWEEEEGDSGDSGEEAPVDAPPPPGDFMTLDPAPPAPAPPAPRKPAMDTNRLIYALLGVTAVALVVTLLIILLKK